MNGMALFFGLIIIAAALVYIVPTVLIVHQNDLHSITVTNESQTSLNYYVKGMDTFTMITSTLASPIGMMISAFAVVLIVLALLAAARRSGA